MNWDIDNLDWEEPEKELEELSLVRIQSKDPKNNNFGTGFIFYKDKDSVFILTCAHVIRDVGGKDKVKVKQYSATVVFQSPNNLADDLAILKIIGLKNLPCLPLEMNRQTRIICRIHGYSEYDPRNKIYEINNIKGYLGEKIKIEGENQLNPIDSWKLIIDQHMLLKPGNSGSPVINKKTCNVLGIVSHLEGNGKVGRAVSVCSLIYNWEGAPESLFRDRYYVEPIVNLLKDIFNNNDENLYTCFESVFPDIFTKKLNYLTARLRIRYLVIYCHRRNHIDLLLDIIKSKYPRKHKKFISEIDPNQKSKIRSISIKKYNFCSYIQQLFKNRKSNKYSILVLETIGEFPESPEIIEAKLQEIAHEIGLERSQIKIKNIYKGSVKIEIEIPSEYIDKVIKLYDEDRALMNELGIKYLSETFKHSYDIKKIESFLKKYFKIEEIIKIYSINFNLSIEDINVTNSKNEIISRLLYYVEQNSQIPILLEMLSEHNPKAYSKYEPYHNTPRRPSSQGTRSRIRINSNSNRWNFIRAGINGTGIAFLGFMVLASVLFLLEYVNNPPLTELITSFYFLILFPVTGNIVGEVVLKSLNNTSSEQAGRIAASSYFVGLTLLPNIFRSILEIIGSSDSVVAVIGLATGGFLAYQRAR